MDPTIIKQLATQTCSAGNITIMRGQLIRLSEIRSMLHADIREAEQNQDTAALERHVLFGLQLVKATCDVVVTVAGEFGPPPMKVISTLYSGAQPSAELLGKSISGQSVSMAEWATGLNAGIHAGIKVRLGVDSDMVNLADLNQLKTDIFINAVAGDADGVVQAIIDRQLLMAGWVADLTTKADVSTVMNSGIAVAKAALAYKAAYDEWKSGDLSDVFATGIAVAKRQIDQISGQIAGLERDLAACSGAQKPSQFGFSAIDMLRNRPSGPSFLPGR